jgi:hypothetical protein
MWFLSKLYPPAGLLARFCHQMFTSTLDSWFYQPLSQLFSALSHKRITYRSGWPLPSLDFLGSCGHSWLYCKQLRYGFLGSSDPSYTGLCSSVQINVQLCHLCDKKLNLMNLHIFLTVSNCTNFLSSFDDRRIKESRKVEEKNIFKVFSFKYFQNYSVILTFGSDPLSE